MKKIHKGSRVTATNIGRTKNWGIYLGTVTSKRGNSVFVNWDRTSFEDEMDLDEVKLI